MEFYAKFKEAVDKLTHRYGMKQRGFSIGCQPKEGLVDWYDTVKGETGYWSIIEYDRKLTDDEVKKYELEELK